MLSIQSKKFLIIESYFWNPHVKRTLEIGKKIRNNTNDQVEFALFMNTCFYENNFTISKSFLNKAIYSVKKLFKQIQLLFFLIINKFDYKIYFLNKIKYQKQYFNILDKSNKNLKFVKDCVNLKGNDIEQFSHGIASAMISRHRNGNFLIKNDKKALKNLILETLAYSKLLKNLIQKKNITDIVVFNGRFCLSFASMKIAEKMNLSVHFHESSRSNWTYYFSKKKQFVTSEMSKYFDDVWANSPFNLKEKNDIGKKFFDLSQNRNTSNLGLNRSFLKDYNDFFPFEKYKNRKIFSIFTSSDDEYFLFELDKKNNKASNNQSNKIIKCIQMIEKVAHEYRSDILILIRVHPNDTSDLSNKINKKYSTKNLLIIDSNSKINSYDLLNKSDLVFSYRTTLGVEAIYKWKPSVMLTDCVYWKQNVCLEGDTEEKIENILRNLFLKKLKVTKFQFQNALKIGFGYFYANGEYKYLNIKNSKLKY